MTALLDKGFAVVAPDVFQTGELKGLATQENPKKKGPPPDPKDFDRYPVNTSFAGYTYSYNHPVFANRVRDILTTVLFARDMLKAGSNLIG